MEAGIARWSVKNFHRPFPLSQLVYEVIKHFLCFSTIALYDINHSTDRA